MATNLPHLQDIQQISETPRIVRILGGNPSKFTLQGTNTYLIGPRGSLTLVDTGQGERAWRDTLTSHLSSSSGTVTSTLITHWHPDHLGGVPDLLDLPATANTAVYKHNPTYLGYGEVAERIHASALHTENWRPIADGQTFDVGGGWRLRALHAPGHAADHMCFLLLAPDGAIRGLFTGDNVLGHGTAVFEDLGVYMASLEKMRDAIRSAESGSEGKVTLYPGHGDVVGDGRAKLCEYIEHRAMRERQVWDVLCSGEKESWTAMEIVKVVYKDVPEELHVPAAGGVLQILKKLEGEGKVVRRGDRWSVVVGSSL